MDKYIHTILEKYNDELKNYSPVVKNGTTDRENRFNQIKKDIEKEFEKYTNLFMIVHVENDFYKQKETYHITYNNINVVYIHDGYNSGVSVFVTSVIDKKSVYLGTNCKIVKTYDKDVKFITIISDYYDYINNINNYYDKYIS